MRVSTATHAWRLGTGYSRGSAGIGVRWREASAGSGSGGEGRAGGWDREALRCVGRPREVCTEKKLKINKS